MRHVSCKTVRGRHGGDAGRSALRRTGTVLAVLVAASALALPSTAQATLGGSSPIDPSLQAAISASPGSAYPVIVQGDGKQSPRVFAQSVADVLGASRHLSQNEAKQLATGYKTQFKALADVSLVADGSEVEALAGTPGVLSISLNGTVVAQGDPHYDNPQHWVDALGVDWYWHSDYAHGNRATQAGTIAVVDSGIDNPTGNFGNRIVATVDLGGGTSSGDANGHGTFVASIAAGTGRYTGVAPTANLIALNVFNAQGAGTIGDVIRACDWILANQVKYDIRVANFSLQGSQPASFLNDPLDNAVERLWEAGVVVVTAAGNYATGGQPSGVIFAPANDPFVITVGAIDINHEKNPKKHVNAPWSAYGYTPDGFAKPDVGAPGRYMIAQVPSSDPIYDQHPGQRVGPNAIELSGTSFSAAAVSGVAADLVGAHPSWTPDQVKGAIMLKAFELPRAMPSSEGVGEVNLQKTLEYYKDGHRGLPPNPNLALEAFLMPDPSGGALPVFNADAWITTAQLNPAWNTASWTSASWSSASWSSASWSSASWTSASWSSASWTSASWTSASWTSVAGDNNASSDGLGDG